MLKDQAITQIRKLLADCWILDTETTGLDNSAEIVEVGIIDQDGNTVFHEYAMPVRGIPQAAIDVHGLTEEKLKSLEAKTQAQVRYLLVNLLGTAGKGKQIVIYNKKFDYRMLRNHGVDLDDSNTHCAMLLRQAVEGTARWQKLEGGDHSTIGDCRATLKMMRDLAKVEAAPVPTGIPGIVGKLAEVFKLRLQLEQEEKQLKRILGDLMAEQSLNEVLIGNNRASLELSVTGCKIADGYTIEVLESLYPSLVDREPRLKSAANFVKKVLTNGGEVHPCLEYKQEFSATVSPIDTTRS